MSNSVKISQSTIKNEKIVSIFHKMVEDKKAISAYFKGDITLKELHSKGIKFVKAL